MTLTLALPHNVEESLLREAARMGVPSDEYALRILEQHLTPTSRQSQAIAALQTWRDEAEQRDRVEPDNQLLQSLDADRLSNRPLFPPELKGTTW